MIPITSLWLPILVSAIFVFIASTVIHMVLKYHDRDFKKVPAEDEVMTALRKFQIPPGEYYMPRPDSMALTLVAGFARIQQMMPVTRALYGLSTHFIRFLGTNLG